MSMEPVLFEREGTITRINLDRPEAGNAIDLPTARPCCRSASL